MIRTATLEIAYEESGPAEGQPVVLLHGFPDDVHAYEGSRLPSRREARRVFVPTLSRVRADPVSRCRDTAIGSTGGARPRSRRFHGFARVGAGGSRRIRLGWPRGLRRRRIVAAAGRRVSLGRCRRLQYPEYRRGRKTAFARDRIPPLVSMVFPHRAGSGGLGNEPGPAVPAALGIVVPKLPL